MKSPLARLVGVLLPCAFVWIACSPAAEKMASEESAQERETTPPPAPEPPVDETISEPEEVSNAEEDAPHPDGLLKTAQITQDEELLALLEQWKRRPVKKSEQKKVKGALKSWKEDLLKGLLHEEPNIRSNVAAALGAASGSKDILGVLIDRMRNDPDGDVRAHIAKVFVKRKSRAAQKALVEQMRSDENPSARANAAWALSKHGDKKCAQAFAEALQDPESWVRLYAVAGVKKHRVKKAIPSLRLLLSDKSDLVAKKAREALKSLGAR